MLWEERGTLPQAELEILEKGKLAVVERVFIASVSSLASVVREMKSRGQVKALIRNAMLQDPQKFGQAAATMIHGVVRVR